MITKNQLARITISPSNHSSMGRKLDLGPYIHITNIY